MLLTDEEIDLCLLDPDTISTKESYHNLLKAQLKKVVEWLQSREQPLDSNDPKTCEIASYKIGTWQALLDEVKDV